MHKAEDCAFAMLLFWGWRALAGYSGGPLGRRIVLAVPSLCAAQGVRVVWMSLEAAR